MAAFASPVMIAVFGFIVLVQAMSLLLLLVNVRAYRNHVAKYDAFLTQLGGDTRGFTGRVVLAAYIAVTIAAAVATVALFLWQPHLL